MEYKYYESDYADMKIMYILFYTLVCNKTKNSRPCFNTLYIEEPSIKIFVKSLGQRIPVVFLGQSVDNSHKILKVAQIQSKTYLLDVCLDQYRPLHANLLTYGQ